MFPLSNPGFSASFLRRYIEARLASKGISSLAQQNLGLSLHARPAFPSLRPDTLPTERMHGNMALFGCTLH